MGVISPWNYPAFVPVQALSAVLAAGKGIADGIASVENFDTGITPPIISMAPNCKTGSELVWIAQWKWDAEKKEAVRTPATGYFTSPDKEKYGGKCFLTKISDELG